MGMLSSTVSNWWKWVCYQPKFVISEIFWVICKSRSAKVKALLLSYPVLPTLSLAIALLIHHSLLALWESVSAWCCFLGWEAVRIALWHKHQTLTWAVFGFKCALLSLLEESFKNGARGTMQFLYVVPGVLTWSLILQSYPFLTCFPHPIMPFQGSLNWLLHSIQIMPLSPSNCRLEI